MTSAGSHYQTIEKYFRRLSRLEHLYSIASWDEAVMMPTGGGEGRALALAEANVLRTELLRSAELSEAFAQVEGETKSLNDWQKANVRETRRVWLNITSVEPALIEKRTLANLRSEQAWRDLRPQNNWRDYLPLFKEVVALAREEAAQRSAASGLPAYDCMMQQFEPGLQSVTVDRVFGELKSFLPGLIKAAEAKSKERPARRLERQFSIDRQRQLVRRFMEWMQFDFRHGRLDESHHPFCGGVSRDVRLTTKYNVEDFLPGFLAVLHESGHAKYEQGLPTAWLEQPVGQPRGMAVHESQSLFAEMQIGNSREFFEYATPVLQQSLAEPGDPADYWTAENLHRQSAAVTRSLIRVKADEVTYPAHILVRYDIERALIEGRLEAADIPEIWDQKMREYLGLSTAGNDKDGCMQDVHWPAGLFGYFPSYTLGAMVAAQLAAALDGEIPQWRSALVKGEISQIFDWLKQKIWQQGSFYTTEELVTKATGQPLAGVSFRRHLESRYLGR